LKEYAAHASQSLTIFFAAADNLYRLDPVKFPAVHSLANPPFYGIPQRAPDTAVGGMPYGNALFAYLYFTTFVKMVNMAPYLCPTQEETLDVLFERRIPKPDGSPSDVYFINEHLIGFLMFNVACSLNASYNHRKEKKEVFRIHVACLKAASAAGMDWRAQLRDCLKKWEPDFREMNRKKRRLGTEDMTTVSLETQVNPDFI